MRYGVQLPPNVIELALPTDKLDEVPFHESSVREETPMNKQTENFFDISCGIERMLSNTQFLIRKCTFQEPLSLLHDDTLKFIR